MDGFCHIIGSRLPELQLFNASELMSSKQLSVTSLCFLILTGLSAAQVPPVKTTTKPRVTVDTKLRLSFLFPESMGQVQKKTPAPKNLSGATQFKAQEDKDFVASLSFIPQSTWRGKRDVWPSLERLVGNAMKRAGAQLHHVQAVWVDELPAIQFQAISKKSKDGVSTLLVGQFILATDAVIFAQTASTKPNPKQLNASLAFLNGITRPGFKKPRDYQIAIGNMVVSYPPGILPRYRDGLLHLEDPMGNLGLLLRVQETRSNDPREVICSLAESLDEVTKKSSKAPTLLQGPGAIRGLETNVRAWGFTCRIPSPSRGNEIPSSREVFLRYYQTTDKRLMVSGFVRAGPDLRIASDAQRRVSAILNSIHEKMHKDE